MAEVKFNKGSVEWQMFTEFWKICQKYWEVEETDDYWKALHDDAIAFGKKYDTEFAENIMIAFMNTQDSTLKKSRR